MKRIDYKLALLVYKCQQGAAPSRLADELPEQADFEARCRLRSASLSSLVIRRTLLSAINDRAFPIAVARVWNSLARHIHAVTASLLQSPQDTSLQPLLAVTMLLCLRSDSVISGQTNCFLPHLCEATLYTCSRQNVHSSWRSECVGFNVPLNT